MSTKIEWTEETWNPIVGCSKVSAGCQNCYAEKMAYRLKCMGQAKYQEVVDENGWTGEISFCVKTLQQPLHWKKPRTIFVNSMGDSFHEKVWISWIDSILTIIEKCPQHTFILLTKRPGEALSKLSQLDECCYPYPLPSNVWFLVTCEDQANADRRIPQMMKIKEKIGGASVWGVSAEPLLEAIDFRPWMDWLNWVIVGGETGSKARPMHPDWARSIRDQCVEALVPFFFKKHGEWQSNPARDWHKHETCRVENDLMFRHGAIYRRDFPEYLRLLDGRVWDEMPLEAPLETRDLRQDLRPEVKATNEEH